MPNSSPFPPCRRFYIPFFVLFCSIAWSACVKGELDTFDGEGKRPVYVALSALDDIRNLPPQPIQQSGAIFLRDSLFFLLEQQKGIHVFHVADSVQVINLTFLQIPAITAFTVAGNRLYADSWKDLITIDISDLYQIQLLERQTGVFTPLLYPPLYDGIFECVDESRGAVVGWQDAFLQDAHCRTVN